MDIYEKHAKAFSQVSAGALVVNGVQVGTLAFKYPSKGEGKLYCFLHLHGHNMVSGWAGGCGYDKVGAALESAARYLSEECLGEYPKFVKFDCDGENFQKALKNIGIEYYRGV